jgi:TetR/AcrR family transcriptional repressor of nem operon
MNAKPNTSVETAILDAAQNLVQQRGFNAFSYRDLAEQVGVKTSSIHYYFPSKADLGRAIMHRYTEELRQILAAIEAETTDPRRRVALFIDVFAATLRSKDKLCLGGMLASDFLTLPSPIQTEVKAFFVMTETWLARVLAAGQQVGVFHPHSPEVTAKTMIGTLEGALAAARAFEDEQRFTDAAQWLQTMLKAL